LKFPKPTSLRSRLTFWYVSVLTLLLFVYAAIVFAFQYAVLTRQMLHDEVQDVVTVEGLLYFDSNGILQLKQDYYSRPQSHLLVDRYMEALDTSGNLLYSSPTLHGMRLGGRMRTGEGDRDFDEHITRLADGSHVFVISHIHGMDGKNLLLRLGYSLAPLRTRMEQFLLLLIIAIPVALTLAAIAGQTIARKALRPIDLMTERAAGITANNLHDRLSIQNPDDELGRMAEVFNHLLGRLDEAFRQLRRFTADAAHELRTPLASIRTVGEVALAAPSESGRAKQAIENILEEASKLNETIDSLLLLSRAETSQATGLAECFPVQELVSEVVSLLGVMMEDSDVHVASVNHAAENLLVQADRSLLRIAFVNLIHNAWKFSPGGSTIRIEYLRNDSENTIEIAIHDAGPGISHEERRRIFERFYTGTTHPVSGKKGTGLGLSIAKLVIERADGRIYFADSEAGARCVVILPVPNDVTL
jgi:signal transduction histidine kinase